MADCVGYDSAGTHDLDGFGLQDVPKAEFGGAGCEDAGSSFSGDGTVMQYGVKRDAKQLKKETRAYGLARILARGSDNVTLRLQPCDGWPIRGYDQHIVSSVSPPEIPRSKIKIKLTQSLSDDHFQATGKPA